MDGDIMKLKKLTAAVIAAMTAITPFSSNLPVFTPVTASAEDTAAAELPDWVPTDFDSAVNFRNSYGATHIDNGLICVVYPKRNTSRGEAGYGYSMESTPDAGEILKHDIFSSEYSATCFYVFVYQPQKQGDIELQVIDNHAESARERETAEPSVLDTYTFSVDDDLSIAETDIYSWLPDCSREFSDYLDVNGEVSAHDNYVVFCTVTIEQFGDRWEPDSSNKYENFKYLLTSDCTMEVRDMYCDGSIDRIYVCQAEKDGYENLSWVRTSSARPDSQESLQYTMTADCIVLDNAKTVLLSGDARVTMTDSETGEPVVCPQLSESEYGCWLFRECDIGGGYVENPAITNIRSNPSIISYKDLSEEREYGFHLEDVNRFLSNYTSKPEETSITRYDNNSYDLVFKLKKTVSGDVNGDGKFSIADLVVFKKWLLGADGAELADWKAADLCSDGVLDTFDLCRMRQLLAENYPELKNAPVIRDDYGKVTDEQRITLTDALSKMYPGFDLSDFTFEYSPDHPLSNYFAGPCFYVYYKGILAHGYGDLSLIDNVYAAFDYKGNPTIELLIDPRKYKDIDLAPENMLTEEEAYDRDYYLDHDLSKIIFFGIDDSSSRLNQYIPKLAYMLKDRNQTYERIIDAVTGKEIELISYLVP